MRKGISVLVRKIEFELRGLKRGRGRPKITRRLGLENDMKDLDLQIEIV